MPNIVTQTISNQSQVSKSISAVAELIMQWLHSLPSLCIDVPSVSFKALD
jgi:hypothetical protein